MLRSLLLNERRHTCVRYKSYVISAVVDMKGKKIRLRLFFSVSLLALTPFSASANPQDPTVQAGNASFSQSANKLEVYQSSDKAVIDWRSFNIDAGEHTKFHQPSVNSFTLNRVRSNDPSYINGMLSANGNVAILNPNGIYFGDTSRIDVGGLIATTTDINDDDFMMGGIIKFSAPGQNGTAIVNEGYITAREGGLVGLVAPHVENRGVIEARLGKVALVSGDTFTLDMAGDGLIHVAVSEDQARRVINEGRISADGGSITLRVADARANVDNLIVNKGTLSANSVGMKNGKIVLGAGGSNKSSKTGSAVVLHEGMIEAKGEADGETGGNVHLLGDHVGAMKNSRIDVSGKAGGGEVLIGGEYQGGGNTQTAQRTYINETATINASATDTGDGGRVIIWADETTRYYGHIDAKGGMQAGNGGLIEVSGKSYLDFSGTVSTNAANGEAGSLLLDPTDITISNAADSNVNGTTPFSPNLDNGPSNLNVATLLGVLAGSNVTVQTRATGTQNGDITIVDPVSWSANTQLTLNAHNKIIVDADISARNRLTMIAADIDLNANLIEHASGASLYIQPNANGLSVGLAGGAGSFNLSNADLDFIQPGWNSILIGLSTSTADMDIGARTWNSSMTFYTRTGEMQFNGAQDFGSFNATIQTRNLSINNTLSGIGTLTIQPDSNISVGLAGAAGTLDLSTAELDNIQDGWSVINIGRTSSTQDLVANAYNWNDSVSLRVGNANIQIDGNQNVGTNDLSLSGGTLVLNADLIGTGMITLAPNTNRTIGVNGGAGAFQVDGAMLDRLTGWSILRVGTTTNTQDMEVNAKNWDYSLELFSGTGSIIINGNQDMGANDFLLRSNGDPLLNGDLIGTGTITLAPTSAGTTTGLAGGVGTFNLDVSDLNHVVDGWGQIVIGLTGNDGDFNVGAYTWNDNIRFQTDAGNIFINGAQNFGSNDFTLRSDADPTISAALIGSGVLTFEGEATNTTIGINETGTFNLSTADLNNITDGWSQIIIGKANGTGSMRVGAHTWSDPVHLQRLTGSVTITGAQDIGSNDLTITTDSIAVNAALNGTGTLILQQANTNSSMGLAGASGNFGLMAAELNNITDGWSQIILGRNDSTATVNVNAYTWNDNITIRGGSGEMRFVQGQNFGSNNVIIESDSLRIDNNMTGTGNLTIAPSDVATSIGLAGGAGTLNLTVAEIDKFVDGWNSIMIGRADGTGEVTLDSYANWSDPVTILKDGTDMTNVINIAGAQTITGASDASLFFNGNVNLGADITTDNTDLSFGGPVILLGNRVLTTGTGNIVFGNTLDGNFNLDTVSSGNVNFLGDVGGAARIADVYISGATDIASTGVYNADNLIISGATGTAGFANADVTTLVDIDAQNITGVYQGTSGILDANTGTITATTSFSSLDISGVGATLSAGYIGAPGSASQTMANLITIDSLLMPPPDNLYKFSGFTIGFVPPTDNGIDASLQSEISAVLRHTFSQESPNFPNVFSLITEDEAVLNGHPAFSFGWPQVMDGILYIEPELKKRINVTNF